MGALVVMDEPPASAGSAEGIPEPAASAEMSDSVGTPKPDPPGSQEERRRPKARRLLSWPKRTLSGQEEAWQNYGLAVTLIGFLPLLPAAIEWFVGREISEDTLIITVAVYCLTIAVASNNRLYFGLLLTISVLISSTYGIAADPPVHAHLVYSDVMGITVRSFSKGAARNNTALFIVTLLTFLSVLVERFSRHVRSREEFFEFLKGKDR